jgi:putative NIF3 family GTP cyclohydrolase 1 type 2
LKERLSRQLKNDIAIYAAHTNMDNINQGVNAKIADKLELEKNVRYYHRYQAI